MRGAGLKHPKPVSEGHPLTRGRVTAYSRRISKSSRGRRTGEVHIPEVPRCQSIPEGTCFPAPALARFNSLRHVLRTISKPDGKPRQEKLKARSIIRSRLNMTFAATASGESGDPPPRQRLGLTCRANRRSVDARGSRVWFRAFHTDAADVAESYRRRPREGCVRPLRASTRRAEP